MEEYISLVRYGLSLVTIILLDLVEVEFSESHLEKISFKRMVHACVLAHKGIATVTVNNI